MSLTKEEQQQLVDIGEFWKLSKNKYERWEKFRTRLINRMNATVVERPTLENIYNQLKKCSVCNGSANIQIGKVVPNGYTNYIEVVCTCGRRTERYVGHEGIQEVIEEWNINI